jgi:hypothetical protein
LLPTPPSWLPTSTCSSEYKCFNNVQPEALTDPCHRLCPAPKPYCSHSSALYLSCWFSDRSAALATVAPAATSPTSPSSTTSLPGGYQAPLCSGVIHPAGMTPGPWHDSYADTDCHCLLILSLSLQMNSPQVDVYWCKTHTTHSPGLSFTCTQHHTRMPCTPPHLLQGLR